MIRRLNRQLNKLFSITLILAAPQAVQAQLNGNAVTTAPGSSTAVPIRVVYPTAEKIDASSSFIVGCCQPGDTLTCNGDPVRLSKEGFFAHVVPLKPGDNKFTLVESGSVSATIEVHASRSVEPPPIPPGKLLLQKETLQPSQDTAVMLGDTIHFSVRATPGAEVTVDLGDKTINLRTVERPVASRPQVSKKTHGSAKATPLGTKITVNGGLSVAYGKSFQRSSHERNDTYFGFYKINSDDDWREIHAKVTARINGKAVSCQSKASFSVMRGPLLAETVHDDTIVRVGPNASRTTPLVKDIRLLVDGWQGDQIRCIYATNKHFWIAREDLSWENLQSTPSADKRFSGTPGPAPSAVARAINVVDDEFGSFISLPLSQRLPYQVVQSVKPNTLTLKVFGVTADTDWVSDPRLGANAEEDNAVKPVNHIPIENISWSQPADGEYDVTVNLQGHRQWGYKVTYEGSELRLHVRRPPHLDRNNASMPLTGLKICVDPGHGGKEIGAVGPSGINESVINLAIALRLQTLLENAGAKVIMTRTTDQDVSLSDRVRIANENKVDILLSVHNNSLPDGRDPWRERGSSTYWYHPQSTELGRCLKNGLLSRLNLPDLGSRFQNLFLARPSFMPAVLAEVGFVINPEEYAMLISAEGQNAAAEGLLKGLEDYLIGPAKKSSDRKQ